MAARGFEYYQNLNTTSAYSRAKNMKLYSNRGHRAAQPSPGVWSGTPGSRWGGYDTKAHTLKQSWDRMDRTRKAEKEAMLWDYIGDLKPASGRVPNLNLYPSTPAGVDSMAWIQRHQQLNAAAGQRRGSALKARQDAWRSFSSPQALGRNYSPLSAGRHAGGTSLQVKQSRNRRAALVELINETASQKQLHANRLMDDPNWVRNQLSSVKSRGHLAPKEVNEYLKNAAIEQSLRGTNIQGLRRELIDEQSKIESLGQIHGFQPDFFKLSSNVLDRIQIESAADKQFRAKVQGMFGPRQRRVRETKYPLGFFSPTDPKTGYMMQHPSKDYPTLGGALPSRRGVAPELYHKRMTEMISQAVSRERFASEDALMRGATQVSTRLDGDSHEFTKMAQRQAIAMRPKFGAIPTPDRPRPGRQMTAAQEHALTVGMALAKRDGYDIDMSKALKGDISAGEMRRVTSAIDNRNELAKRFNTLSLEGKSYVEIHRALSKLDPGGLGRVSMVKDEQAAYALISARLGGLGKDTQSTDYRTKSHTMTIEESLIYSLSNAAKNEYGGRQNAARHVLGFSDKKGRKAAHHLHNHVGHFIGPEIRAIVGPRVSASDMMSPTKSAASMKYVHHEVLGMRAVTKNLKRLDDISELHRLEFEDQVKQMEKDMRRGAREGTVTLEMANKKGSLTGTMDSSRKYIRSQSTKMAIGGSAAINALSSAPLVHRRIVGNTVITDINNMPGLRAALPLIMATGLDMMAYGAVAAIHEVFDKNGVSPPWPQLDQDTIEEKGHQKVYRRTGRLMGAISVRQGLNSLGGEETSADGFFPPGPSLKHMASVGWFADTAAHTIGAPLRSNLNMAEVASVLEFGTAEGTLPPRPLSSRAADIYGHSIMTRALHYINAEIGSFANITPGQIQVQERISGKMWEEMNVKKNLAPMGPRADVDKTRSAMQQESREAMFGSEKASSEAKAATQSRVADFHQAETNRERMMPSSQSKLDFKGRSGRTLGSKYKPPAFTNPFDPAFKKSSSESPTVARKQAMKQSEGTASHRDDSYLPNSNQDRYGKDGFDEEVYDPLAKHVEEQQFSGQRVREEDDYEFLPDSEGFGDE